MKKSLAIFIIAFSLLTIFALPHFAAAQTAYKAPTLWPTGYWGPLLSCTGNGVGGMQCTNLCDLIGTFINIIYFIITICFFVIAPILFLIGGIMIMTAGANPEMLSKGKSTLKGAVIGIVIILCRY